MFETLKKSGTWSLKNWVAAFLFGAIIVVFALWGVNPDQFSTSAGGVAAVVNGQAIPLTEYRNRVDQAEQNARRQLDMFPESQKRLFLQRIRSQTLDELVFSEIVYQAAVGKGVRAPDAEVGAFISNIPFLQENGRFKRERYQAFITNMRLTPEEFERQVRKQIVTQKVQSTFLASSAPVQKELQVESDLSRKTAKIRYMKLGSDELKAALVANAGSVGDYAKSHRAEIEKYYQDNRVRFTSPESVMASHILLRVDDKNKAEAVAAKMKELRSQLTTQNFSDLAKKHSEDPGSKTKGGDLGEFQKGRMVPEFEKAAFGLKVGEISEPIKTDYGYHIIWVRGRSPGGLKELAAVETEIARELWAHEQAQAVLNELSEKVKSGNMVTTTAWLKSKGIEWSTPVEFKLSDESIQTLEGQTRLVDFIVARQGRTGIIDTVIEGQGQKFIVDIVSWKESEPSRIETEGSARKLAIRRSGEVIEEWAKKMELEAKVEKNLRLIH